MTLKEDWFQQWLDRDNYVFWYSERDNEVWKNLNYAIVWNPSVGMRLMIPRKHWNEDYLRYTYIPIELAKQEQ